MSVTALKPLENILYRPVSVPKYSVSDRFHILRDFRPSVVVYRELDVLRIKLVVPFSRSRNDRNKKRTVFVFILHDGRNQRIIIQNVPVENFGILYEAPDHYFFDVSQPREFRLLSCGELAVLMIVEQHLT